MSRVPLKSGQREDKEVGVVNEDEKRVKDAYSRTMEAKKGKYRQQRKDSLRKIVNDSPVSYNPSVCCYYSPEPHLNVESYHSCLVCVLVVCVLAHVMESL